MAVQFLGHGRRFGASPTQYRGGEQDPLNGSGVETAR